MSRRGRGVSTELSDMTEHEVRAFLRSVDDPEAGMNIVDLGLVYAIVWTPERMSPQAQSRFGWS
jgi:metal-sulfur cluster biosynthetic enzyme